MESNNLKLQIECIRPEELPRKLALLLNMKYGKQLSDFVLMFDKNTDTLYVRRDLPEEIVSGFSDFINYPDYAVCEDEKLSVFADQIMENYGVSNYIILHDAQKSRCILRKRREGKARAENILPFILSDDVREAISFPEEIVAGIDDITGEQKWKTGLNMLPGCEEAVYFFGVLVGAGKIIIKDDGTAEIRNEGQVNSVATEIIAELENTLQNDLKAFEDIGLETDNESIIKLCKHREKSIKTIFEEK